MGDVININYPDVPEDNQDGYAEGEYAEGSFAEGSFAEGSFAEGSFAEGSFAEGSFDEGSFDEGSLDEGSLDEGSLDELEKLFLKFKEEAGGDRGIREAELDIPLADEEAVRRLEAEGNGIWATVGEVAYAHRKKRVTIWRQIRRGKWIVRRVDNRRSKTGYSYLIWIINPLTIKKIKDERKMTSVKIEVSRPELFVLRDMGKIDEETFTTLWREGSRKFRFQLLVTEKTLHQVFKKGIVLPE